MQTLTLSLPHWLEQETQRCGRVIETAQERMRYVVELSARNVAEGTGGPFGAAVFGCESGRLYGVGVNLVVAGGCSHAHAEMVALAMAEKALEIYSLALADEPCELLCSCEPCAMCFGAIPWSGVKRVVCAAADADARAIGFDEGPKLPDWAAVLRERGIEVVEGVEREAARAVLEAYGSGGGVIYNG